MIRHLVPLLFFVFLQDDQDAARRAAEEQQRRMAEAAAAAEQRRQIETREQSIKSMNEFLNPTPASLPPGPRWTESVRRQKYSLLSEALDSLQLGNEQLDLALTTNAKLKDPARRIEKSAKAFLDFIALIDNRKARFDPENLKTLTASQLREETLSSARKLTPALKTVIATTDEDNEVVDIQFMKDLPEIRRQLMRLQWMAQRLK